MAKPKYKLPDEIVDGEIRKQSDLKLLSKIYMSGTYIYIGTANSANDECLFITDDETIREPIYFSSTEAKLLIAVLQASIEENTR